MLLCTKLQEPLMNKVSPSGLAGCDHKIFSSLILIIIALMWPQHQAYGIGQLHAVNVPTPLLLWVRTPVMSPQLQTLPSPSQPEVRVGKLVQVLLHPIRSVSFLYFIVTVGHLIIGHVCRFKLHQVVKCMHCTCTIVRTCVVIKFLILNKCLNKFFNT